MKLPPPNPAAVKLLDRFAPDRPGVVVKKLFGQPAAFLNGNLFFGVFGDDLFVRLSEDDLQAAHQVPGSRPFEPMAGRAMRGYCILPEAVWRDEVTARRWVDRARRFAATLPPKG